MRVNDRSSPVPIYTTSGEWSALLYQNNLFNTQGEWIGWVAENGDVFDVDGYYVGWISEDRRVLRRRSAPGATRRPPPPPPPEKVLPPPTIPLAPMMPELPHGVIDVLEEEPERLHTRDTGELKEDMD